MRLIVGLGNPGARYREARHNVGYRVVECLAERAGISLDETRYEGRFGRGFLAGQEVALLLPETFMNGSGEAVLQAVVGLSLEDPGRQLLVILDDIDLPVGRLRVRGGGGDGGQRGLRDILERLESTGVPRLRVGVGRPPAGVDPVDWVLQPFAPADLQPLERAVPRAAEAVVCLLEEGLASAMDRFNGPLPGGEEGGESG
jgi:PTH1 family peptidyl-tRNA hydrolase